MELKASVQLTSQNKNFDNCTRKLKKITSKTFHKGFFNFLISKSLMEDFIFCAMLEGYSMEDYLRVRVNLFHGELSVPEEGAMYFLSLNHMGKNSS